MPPTTQTSIETIQLIIVFCDYIIIFVTRIRLQQMTDCLAHPKYSFYIECLLLVAFVNVFCVEDCERVHKSVRSLLPRGTSAAWNVSN